MKPMKRLRSLDVHEISLVKNAANAKKYLVRKHQQDAPMPDAQSIREQLLAVPKSTVFAIEMVAKAAAEAGEMTEEAQAAMKAAGRILAPHASNISSEQVTNLMQAIGMLAGDKADTDAQDADEDELEDDADIEDAEPTDKSADDEEDEDDEGEEEIDKDDDEDEEDDEEDDGDDEEAVDKDDDEDEEDNDGGDDEDTSEDVVVKADFDEGKHPRDDGGRFGSGGSAGSSGKGPEGLKGPELHKASIKLLRSSHNEQAAVAQGKSNAAGKRNSDQTDADRSRQAAKDAANSSPSDRASQHAQLARFHDEQAKGPGDGDHKDAHTELAQTHRNFAKALNGKLESPRASGYTKDPDSGSNAGGGHGQGKAPGSRGVLGLTRSNKTIRADGKTNENYTSKDHKDAYRAHADKAGELEAKHGLSDPRAQFHRERANFHNRMSQVNKSAEGHVSAEGDLRYAAEQPQAGALTPLETAVQKSAGLDLKGFTEAQRAALEPILKSQAVQAQAHKQLEQAHKEAVAKSQALQHKLDRKEFVAKAAAYPHLGKAEELGAMLHNLHAKDPEGFEAWENVLKAANAAQDSSSLFEERGSRLSPSGSAASQLDQAVEAYVQKSASGLSHDQAMTKFLATDEGRKLYRLERQEAEAARRRA